MPGGLQVCHDQAGDPGHQAQLNQSLATCAATAHPSRRKASIWLPPPVHLSPLRYSPETADLLEEHGHETLTYYAFPDSHWIKLRTNNPLERIMREIRRRTRVVGAFPDGQSCLNLAAARLRHIAGTKWSTRKYMNMTPLFADQTQGAVGLSVPAFRLIFSP